MKRYASHYLLTPEGTALKQQVVVVDGQAVGYFALTEEVEDVEWRPGVIALEPDSGRDGQLTPYWYYPYDLTAMRPVAATQRRRLL